MTFHRFLKILNKVVSIIIIMDIIMITDYYYFFISSLLLSSTSLLLLLSIVFVVINQSSHPSVAFRHQTHRTEKVRDRYAFSCFYIPEQQLSFLKKTSPFTW